MSETRDRAASRRDLMRMTAVGAVAGLTFGFVPDDAEAVEVPEAAPKTSGYRLTPHIQSYYSLARA